MYKAEYNIVVDTKKNYYDTTSDGMDFLQKIRNFYNRKPVSKGYAS